MHITKVQLDNIKSHIAAEFEFGRGTIAITGENGAGKTTIIEAIAFALFDLLDYKKDDFVRRGAKKGSVRVTFISDLDERPYTVYRDTGTGYYIYDEKEQSKVAEKKTDVGTYLNKLLGIEPGTDLEALFRSAIGVPQGTFTADFLRTAAERKKSFDKLLKVEEYRESADRLKDTVRLIEKNISDVNQRIAKAEGQLSRYDELEEEHKTITKNLKELSASLEMLQKEIEELAGVVDQLNKAESKVTETGKLKERLASESESALRWMKAKQDERDKAQTAAEKLKSIENEYKAHTNALDELTRLEVQRNEHVKLKEKTTKIESSISNIKNEIARLEKDIARARRAGADSIALKPRIEEQESLEKKREELIANRAQSQSAKVVLNNIEAERNILREQYKQINAQIKDAEKHKDAEARFQSLQSERTEVETELSRNEKAATSFEHLLKQKKDGANEIARLKKEVTAHEKEIAEFERLSSLASETVLLAERENKLTEALARLRASLERDEKFQTEVKNGLCPILSEKCLNLKEGETLETYFKGQFVSYKTQIALLETEKKELSATVRDAREAEKTVSNLERVRSQLENEKTLLRERENTLSEIEKAIAALPANAKEKVKEFGQKLVLIDAELKNLLEASNKYAGLAPLRQRLKEIEVDGKSKAAESEKVEKTANELETIEKEISATEKALRELKDPRSHAVAWQNEADKEAGLRIEIETANKKHDEHKSQLSSFAEQLKRFSDLDSQLDDARNRRDKTSSAYREYLAAEPLANEFPQRQNEFDKAGRELERKEKEAKEAAQDYDEALKLYDRELHAKERASLSSSRERLAETQANYKNAQTRETSLIIQLKQLSEIRDAMRDEFNKREKLNDVFEATEFIRDKLKEASAYVMETYLYSINIEANQLFREITGDATRTLKWTRDYEIMLEESGYDRPFQNLSGGEQMVAALSVRLALLKQLSDIRIAFFDEPTVNMDRERRERLAQQIGQITNFDQLFVISHDDTFELNVNHTIQVVREKDDDGVQTDDNE